MLTRLSPFRWIWCEHWTVKFLDDFHEQISTQKSVTIWGKCNMLSIKNSLNYLKREALCGKPDVVTFLVNLNFKWIHY
jgi:hypothetical protein